MKLELEQKTLKSGKFTSCIKGTKILHREDGPARETKSLKEYCLLGMNHRIGGPAIESSRSRSYSFLGQEHNLDGPSYEYKDDFGGEEWKGHEYHIFGNYYREKEWKKLVSDPAFMARARAIEKSVDAAIRGLEAPEAIEVGSNSKKAKQVPFWPMMALGLGAAGGLVLAKNKMKKTKVEKAKVKA